MQGTNMDGMDAVAFGPIPSMSDGLTVAQLENMLSDIRYQPLWRQEADKAADYYDSHQLTQERLEKMERLGIPHLVTNLIAPAINAVLGMEAKTRTDWRVTQEDEAHDVPQQMMDAMNAKLSEAERESRADRAVSDAYASQVKTGIGWVEVSRPVDAFAYPYRAQSVHRGEIWWDWRAKQPDLSDARYLIRKRRFDADELEAMMPEHADLIRFAVNDRFNTWQWETRETWDTQLAYAAHVERVTNIDANEWRDAERKRAQLFEVWYRKWVRGQVLRLPSGRAVPFRKDDPRHVMAVQAGMIVPQDAVYAEVRVAFYMGPHRLYDLPSPYKHRHFPYVPFWGFREDRSGVPYGLIRAMMSPQDVVNAADAKMHWLLNARRLVMASDALDKNYNTIRQVQEELSRPDAAVILDPSKPNARFEVKADFELNSQQFQRRMAAANDIENAGGIYKALLGKEGGATSGIAINSLVEQGMITLAEINDNAQFARRQVGELLFSLVREDLLDREFDVAIKKGRKKTVVTLNKRVADPATGEPTIENDVSRVPAKVVLEDVPSTPAFRAQQLQMLTEITKSMPPQFQGVLVPFVMGLTDAPNRDEIVELLRKAGGIPEDLTEEEQSALIAQTNQEAAEAKQIAKIAMQADIAQKTGMAKKVEAEAAKITAEVDRLRSAMGNTGQPSEREVQLQQNLASIVEQSQQAMEAMRAQMRAAQEESAAAVADIKQQLENEQAANSTKRYEADAETRRAEIDAETRRAEAEATVRIAEAEARGKAAAENIEKKFADQLSGLADQVAAIINEIRKPAPDGAGMQITIPLTVVTAEKGGSKTISMVKTDAGYQADITEGKTS